MNTRISGTGKLPPPLHLIPGASQDMWVSQIPPNPETAVMIKDQIKISSRLVVFGTTNSKDSKWAPWELGTGDISLSADNIALLPAAKSSNEQTWAKQEYLGLYRHIVYGKMRGEPEQLWMVYDYRKNTATKLREWRRN